MTDKLTDLIQQARTQTFSISERIQLADEVRELAQGENPVIFLLKELGREHDRAESQKDLLAPLLELGQKPLVQRALGLPYGGSITEGIASFIERHVEENRAALERQEKEYREHIRTKKAATDYIKGCLK